MNSSCLIRGAAALALAASAPLCSAQPTRLAIIEAKGEFGDELTHAAFTRAAQAAKNAGVEDLVFVLDSTGGQQRDAELIARAVHDARHDLNIVVCVRRALGEAVWLMAAGEQLLFSPSGAAGAAVAYQIDPRTGAPEVDQREIASVAAQVAAIAEASRQPGAIYRAMIDPSKQLWTVGQTPGQITYFDTQPFSHDNPRPWDDFPTGVLALTAHQAIELGMGTLSGTSHADIAAALGRTDYVVINDPNRSFILATRNAAQARSKLERETSLATKHTTEFAGEFKRFESLERQTVYQRPYWSGYASKHDARYRDAYKRFLGEVDQYRRRLLDVKHTIDKAADLEKRALQAEAEANRQADTLNELIGYARYAPIAAHIDSSNKATMETAWRRINDELAWCDDQR